jgi:hypothetical protein
VICLVAGCASSTPVHQVNIKSTFQDQDRDVFSDADMLQTYWTTMRAGDAQEGSRRALDFFNQEQSDGMALWEAIVGADRGSIARLIPHLISRVVLDFDATKRKAAIEYWRRDLSKELRAELEREGKATQQLIDRLIERHPAPKGAIDIYVKWSKSALLLSAAQLSQVGKFATISRQGRV